MLLRPSQVRTAELELTTRRLSELQADVSHCQAEMRSVEAETSTKKSQLTQLLAGIAKRRGEISTIESGLSEQLRKKTDAEYQAAEEKLARWAWCSCSCRWDW